MPKQIPIIWGKIRCEQGNENEFRIDEDFTPIIEQTGYEQDFNYLSGGEKMFGLSQQTHPKCDSAKGFAGVRSNRLILDEPTDGFSKKQLSKIRYILAEPKCPQTIMVSHERLLESFADHVLEVEKREDVSETKLA